MNQFFNVKSGGNNIIEISVVMCPVLTLYVIEISLVASSIAICIIIYVVIINRRIRSNVTL